MSKEPFEVWVHPRIWRLHALDADSVRYAWEHPLMSVMREPHIAIAIGIDPQGREVELIARYRDNTIIVFHAIRPPTKKFRKELVTTLRRLS